MKKSRQPALPLLIILIGILLIFLIFFIKGWRLNQVRTSLLERQTELESLATQDLNQLNPDQINTIILKLRENIVDLKQETAFIMPFADNLGWLPNGLGDLAVAAPQLMDLADLGSRLGVELTSLTPALSLLQNEDSDVPLIPAVTALVNDANQNLANADVLFEQIALTRDKIPNEENLPWTIKQGLKAFDENQSLASDGLDVLQILPTLAGAEQPKSWLIMAQNEDEVRPTGGFLSGAGVLTMEKGDIVSLTFMDGNQVDVPLEKPYDWPPQPYYDFMLTEGFGYRDANFWPDFPTSAEEAMHLFTYGQEVPVDGAIAINQRFLQMLVEVTGAVTIPELELTVNSGNTLDALRGSYGYAEDGEQDILNRKDFLAPFAGAVVDKLTNNLDTIDPVWLFKTVQQAAAEKHIQIYTRDANTNAVLNDLGWDGKINNSLNEDTLMVVDTNMSFSKVNVIIDRAITYSVDLDTLIAQVDITYTHSGSINDPLCDQRYTATVWDGINYDNLITGCYWNYLRVYAPTGSQLAFASQHPESADSFLSNIAWDGIALETDDPSGLATFANFIIVPEGNEVNVTFAYQLPDSVLQINDDGSTTYKLNLNKQSGVKLEESSVEIILPAETTLVSSNIDFSNQNGRNLVYTSAFTTNQTYQIVYK